MTIPSQTQVKNQRQEISTKLQKIKWNENKNAKQKQMTKQNVFWAFEFYKKKSLKRPRTLSNYQAKQLWISSKTPKNLQIL